MPLEWQLLMEGGQERGPLSIADLKRLADFGQLQPQALVRPVGGAWQPAGTVAGLFAAPATAPVPAAPFMHATPLVPLAPIAPLAQSMAQPGAPAPAIPTLPPLPPPAVEEDANLAIPLAVLGVVVVGLGGLLVCGMVVMALMRTSLPPPPRDLVAARKPAPGRTGPIAQRGMGGRTKEDSDRFRKFAEEAGKTPWTPSENAAAAPPAETELLREIEAQELSVRQLMVADRALAAEFAALQSEYRAQRISPRQYLRSLRAMVDSTF